MAHISPRRPLGMATHPWPPLGVEKRLPAAYLEGGTRVLRPLTPLSLTGTIFGVDASEAGTDRLPITDVQVQSVPDGASVEDVREALGVPSTMASTRAGVALVYAL